MTKHIEFELANEDLTCWGYSMEDFPEYCDKETAKLQVFDHLTVDKGTIWDMIKIKRVWFEED